MPTTPQGNETLKPTTQSASLQAQILPQTDLNSIAVKSPMYATLRPTQQSILIAIMEDFMSGDIRTDTQMAKDLPVDRKTIYNCRTNPAFNEVLTSLMPELVKAKLPKYLLRIEKHGDKDYKALELLLKYAGLYIPSSQQLNINARLDTKGGQSKPLSVVVDDVLIRLGELGWDDTRVESLVDRFRQLRSEGAF